MVDYESGAYELSATYASAKFDEKIGTDDPDYELKKTVFNEMRELRDEYYAQGYRRRQLKRKVEEAMVGRHGKDGKILNIIRILLSIFSIVLFFI